MGLQTRSESQVGRFLKVRLRVAFCLLLLSVSFTAMLYVKVSDLVRMRVESALDYSGPATIIPEDAQCLRNYFHDVLLVIVYHYPLYDTLPSIIPHYKGAFPNIVVCGPSGDKRFRIFVVDMGPKGYYSHVCLGQAMRVHPGYKGYLFVNDDMVVNWWNFARLDKDRIWTGAGLIHNTAHEVGRRPIPRTWRWWRATDGARKCEKTFREIALSANQSSTDLNVQKLLATHLQNGRNRTLCFKRWSDFVYVPGKLSREFRFLCSMFSKNEVFLEIAIPTILSFLDDYHFWEKAFGIYLPDVFGPQDYSNATYVWPKYTRDICFLHPVKLSGRKGMRNRRIFETRVRHYVRMFTSC